MPFQGASNSLPHATTIVVYYQGKIVGSLRVGLSLLADQMRSVSSINSIDRGNDGLVLALGVVARSQPPSPKRLLWPWVACSSYASPSFSPYESGIFTI